MGGTAEPASEGNAAQPGITPGVARLLKGAERENETLPAQPSADAPADLFAPAAEIHKPSTELQRPVEEQPLSAASRLLRVRLPAPELSEGELIAWRRLVQTTLIALDLVLVFIAFWLALSPRVPFGLMEGLLCAVCMAAGAWVSCLALLLEP